MNASIAPRSADGGQKLLAWLREMRDEQPVWRDPYGIWHVFRYADVARVISDPQVFSSDLGRVFAIGEKFSQGNLLRTDPPRHHTLRRLVGAAFSPKVVNGSPRASQRSPTSCSTPPAARPNSTSSRHWPTCCRSP
ncbi:MAG: hypothetical protein JO296_01365 [Pseudonocardiales bacterium]|nr:hypothetical protein [Pseudonocardiales bacterium]